MKDVLSSLDRDTGHHDTLPSSGKVDKMTTRSEREDATRPNNTKRTATLNDGNKIPLVGFGTASDPKQVKQAVAIALEAGYRHIDTASVYNTESEVGEAIKESGLPREDMFLTTKLRNTDHARVADALDESLQRLQTDYVDLYLIHWPCSVDPKDTAKTLPDWDYVKTWQEMQKLPATGKVKSIGVSNFTQKHLEHLLNDPSCTAVPAVNQIEVHPCYPSRRLIAYNTSKRIHSTAYSCLGSTDSPLYKNEALNEIAKARGKSVQQIILRWHLHKGVSIIPKSVTAERIRHNFELDGWALTVLEVEAIDSIQERFKACSDKHLPAGVQVFTGGDDWEDTSKPAEGEGERYDSAAASVDMGTAEATK